MAEALDRLAAFEAAVGREAPLPDRMPRRWGWVAAAADRFDDAGAALQLEVVPRVPLSPTGQVVLRYATQDPDPADAAPWPRGVHHRAVAAWDGLRLTCEIGSVSGRALPEFLASVAPCEWQIEQRPEPPPRPTTGTWEIGVQMAASPPPVELVREDHLELPRLIQSIESLTLAELPSLVSWPASFGVAAATAFDTLGVEPVFGSTIGDVLMRVDFAARRGPSVSTTFRLSTAATRGAVRVGRWTAAVEDVAGPATDEDVDHVLDSLARSLAYPG